MRTFTLREIWELARTRCGLPVDELVPFKTKYFSGYPNVPIIGITCEERFRLFQARAVLSLPDDPHPCLWCGTPITHVNDGGTGFVAGVTYKSREYSAIYCASCEDPKAPSVLEDGPDAGGLLIWRCSCPSKTSWPRSALDAVPLISVDEHEDLLSCDLANSSIDNAGTKCVSCGWRRGTYRWGLFD